MGVVWEGVQVEEARAAEMGRVGVEGTGEVLGMVGEVEGPPNLGGRVAVAEGRGWEVVGDEGGEAGWVVVVDLGEVGAGAVAATVAAAGVVAVGTALQQDKGCNQSQQLVTTGGAWATPSGCITNLHTHLCTSSEV